MTARSLLTATASRGVALRVDGTRIRGRGLLKDERAFLATPANARTVAALLTLEAHLRAEAEQSERDAAAWIAETQRRHRARQRQHKRDVMATWSPGKVARLAELGRISAEDVRDWRIARAELEQRAYLTAAAAVYR
jgi:hypothetical protein